MLCSPARLRSIALLAAFFAASPGLARAQQTAERLPESAVTPVRAQSMAEVVEREAKAVRGEAVHGMWNGEDGRWAVPPETARTPVRSGRRAVINEWGDPRIGIGFPQRTDLLSLALGGHGVAPAPALVVVGYRDGVEVARSERLELTAGEATRFELDMQDLDRIEFVAEPASGAMAFFALDDLALRPHAAEVEPTLLDFEDLHPRTVLTGSSYRGLRWELGTGLRELGRDGTRSVHEPRAPAPKGDADLDTGGGSSIAATGGTAPTVTTSFRGPQLGGAGGGWIPPDTCGAVGPDHFVSVVNANLSVFDRANGQRLVDVGLDSFFGQTVGDPRALWDPHGQRFAVLATDFSRSSSIHVGVSRTADPTGTWYVFSFRTDQSTDAGRWPDYPTFGVDARGLYTSAYMVGGTPRMTIFAIPTAPLYQSTPVTPAVLAFRSLPWEGAIQPCFTYGDPGSEFLVSRRSSTSLRLRRIDWSGASSATLHEHGLVTVPSHGSPPDAPALGSTTPISTIDYRPMNAVYRDGAVWTTQGVSVGGRAAVRWYEIDVASNVAAQVGTIDDPVWHYYYGSIAVDSRGDVALGFSGSHAGSHVGAFVTGRLRDDPPGTTGAPVLVKAGEGAYERIDRAGRNRWGDYSLTTVDPVDDLGFWSIQEYAAANNTWSTWIVRLGYELFEYGDGLAGTRGVPGLGASARPVLGGALTVEVGSSTGTPSTAGVLTVGLAPAATPLLGGTLLVQPVIVADVTVLDPSTGVLITLPNDPSLPGSSLFLQALQIDAGAAQGVAMSRGLELRPVTR